MRRTEDAVARTFNRDDVDSRVSLKFPQSGMDIADHRYIQCVERRWAVQRNLPSPPFYRDLYKSISS